MTSLFINPAPIMTPTAAVFFILLLCAVGLVLSPSPRANFEDDTQPPQ